MSSAFAIQNMNIILNYAVFWLFLLSYLVVGTCKGKQTHRYSLRNEFIEICAAIKCLTTAVKCQTMYSWYLQHVPSSVVSIRLAVIPSSWWNTKSMDLIGYKVILYLIFAVFLSFWSKSINKLVYYKFYVWIKKNWIAFLIKLDLKATKTF